jgi:hypothetical protein
MTSDVETRSGDATDPDISDELGCGLINEADEGLRVDGDLVVEMEDAAGNDRPGVFLMNRPVGALAKPGTAFRQPGSAQTTQLTSQRVAGGDHERFEFVDRRSA